MAGGLAIRRRPPIYAAYFSEVRRTPGGAAYLLDCCYAVEVLDGAETNGASALFPEVDKFAHIKEATDRFREIGIEVLDSSVLLWTFPDTAAAITYFKGRLRPLRK